MSKRLIIIGLLSICAQSWAALPEFTELVKKVSPAVVNITVIRGGKDRMGMLNDQEVPEPLRRFFEERQQAPSPAAGSGFIISSDGYILTNNHVVDGAKEINVALSDRRERLAEVIGTDELSDLALLKIDEKDLPFVDMGSSENLEPGEWVVAIGSPFGFELSVTAGIVSAKGRSLPGMTAANYVPFIQTDVAINPGNSGGPLFDLDGRVVGINSQIFTRSGGFMGLSFAIPIDVALEVVAQIKEDGKVSRGWLGVGIQSLDRDLAESFGLDRPEGALIGRVFSDSPAQAGGLKVGDIIVEFNGKKIDLSSDLPHIVGRTKAESEATLGVIREKKHITLKLKVGTLAEESLRTLAEGRSDVPAGNQLGVVVTELKRDDRRRWDIDRGVLVQKVFAGPARDEGVRPGDVITTLDNQWVDNVEAFEAQVEALPLNTAISMRVVRNGQPEFLALKLRD